MIRIAEILSYLEEEGIPFTFTGDPAVEVDRFSSLTQYQSGTFTWVKTQENIPTGFDLSVVKLAFVSENVTGNFQNIIRSSQSKRAFFFTIEHFYGQAEEKPPIGQFTYISPKVKLGKNVRIGHNCTLDGEITIGDNTVIWNNVTIVNRVFIGADCTIYSGAVIGQDGYAFTEDDSHRKTMVRHFGGVHIGNRVHIGENVCISRGTIDDTVLEDGVKIDALAHIAHNCYLGENSNISVPCSLSGSVHTGRNVYIAGNIIRNQCTIGDDVFIGLGAVVVNDIPSGEIVAGVPAKPFTKKKQS